MSRFINVFAAQAAGLAKSNLLCCLCHVSCITQFLGLSAGTPLRAWFAEISGDHQDDQVLALQQKCIPCGIFERNNGPCHVIRVFGIR